MLAGVSRLLYGMGRDGVLPKKFFGYRNKKGVPVYNVLLITAICLVGCNMSLGDLFPLIDFGGIFRVHFGELGSDCLFLWSEKRTVRQRRFQIFGRSRLRIFGLYCRLAESFRYGKDHRVHLVGCWLCLYANLDKRF